VEWDSKRRLVVKSFGKNGEVKLGGTKTECRKNMSRRVIMIKTRR